MIISPQISELLIVDPALRDAAALLDGRRADIDVLVLRPDGRALEQIADYLEGQRGVRALHLLCHGEPGALRLAGESVDVAALRKCVLPLARIAAALAPEATVLLYGCSVAAKPAGRRLIDHLEATLGVPVAASVMPVGAKALGGDWMLQSRQGTAPHLAFSAAAQASYSGLLAAVTLTGGDETPVLSGGDDTITANAANVLNAGDVIDGLGGNDVLVISAAQTVSLGATSLTNVETITITAGIQNITANDATVGAGQTLVVNASASADALTWNGSAETNGAFSITGGAGKDSIQGGAGNDTIDGGAGNDTISGGAGNDLLYGGANNDTIYGGAGIDTLSGGDGNDFLYGGTEDDLIYGNGGNDGMSGDAGNDSIWGGDGNDTLIGGTGNDTLSGGAGNDWLWGQDDNDIIYGEDGNDTLSGNAGNDTLYGGAGNDTLSGQAGNDSFYGGDGDDLLRGENDNDVLYGDDGNDTLSGGDGTDTLYGGAGNDSFEGTASHLNGDTIGDFAVGDSPVVSGVDLSALNNTAATGTIDLGSGQGVTLSGVTGVLLATFAGGNTTITLNPNNAPAITSNGGGATALVNAAENQTAVTTVTATDADGQTPTFSITGGADQAKFTINAATGVLAFTGAPNFEAPGDGDTNNTYVVEVTANDGVGGTVAQTITITVTDVAEPAFTSSATFNAAENQTAVSTVAAAGGGGHTITYAITGGADQAKFSINSTTGALAFVSSPNFEAPADADANNTYVVELTASDDIGGSGVQTVTVTVTNVNDAPVFTSGAVLSAPENRNAVANVAATDADGQTLTFSITGGADQAKFSINAATGALAFVSSPNFEAPTDADANNTYVVEVTASDGAGGTAVQAITVNVTNVNEAPAFTSFGGGSSATVNVMEKQTAVTTLSAVEVDGDTLSYSIAGGADQAKFTINAGTGVLSFASSPVFAAPTDSDANNVYLVDVKVDDGKGGSAVQTIQVRVNKLNDAPAFTGNAVFDAVENQTAAISLGTTDVDGDILSYSIVGGADKAKFSINAGTGVLAFINAPNFEAPTDSDGNNTYVVDVMASDGKGGTAIQTITMIVNNANDAPVFAGNMVFDAAENQSVATTLNASDADGHVLSYAISGGVDQAKFKINPGSSILSFVGAPDFEQPGDSDGNNLYQVEVTADDGNGGTTTQAITIAVVDINEPPVTSTVDGVPVQTQTNINTNTGVTQQTIVVPVVNSARTDDPDSTHSALADIPLGLTGTSTQPKVELTASLPAGTGLTVTGATSTLTGQQAMLDLIGRIEQQTTPGSGGRVGLTTEATTFLQSLGERALLSRTVVPTAAPDSGGGTTPPGPIVISGGSNAGTSGSPTAVGLVIDARQLPSNAQLRLDNIEFAAIVGNATVTGGSGRNTVIGDDANQVIILGEDDDVLSGGAGNDTVGSEGGNDKIFGNEGDDLVFGGAGNDSIDGGTGTDIVRLAGTGRADYVMRISDQKLVVTHRNGGIDGTDIVSNIETLRFSGAMSDLSEKGAVSRLYETLLGREADTMGMDNWLKSLEKGSSLQQVAQGILASDEARTTYASLSNADFVSQLYRNALHREADASGHGLWSAALNEGKLSRADVALALANSDEKLAMPVQTDVSFNATDVATLVRLYDSLFGRKPDAAGMNHWLALSEAGMSLADIADQFIQSSEADAVYGSMNNAQFVNALYQNVLQRQAANGEANGWTKLLDDGSLDRGDLLLGFADSAEKITLIGVINTTIETF